MENLIAPELRILETLKIMYYEVVPPNLRTYCSLTSEISKAVLRHFGIETSLLPCQVWYASPNKKIAIGFIGNKPRPNKWDGHVVCTAGSYFIDAALLHFNVEFGINVPAVAVCQKCSLPSQVIGLMDMNDKEWLWWHHPPQGVDLAMPQVPHELISEYSAKLIDRLMEQHIQQVSLGMAGEYLLMRQ